MAAKLHPAIQVRREGFRGCGTRKVGGMYIVSGAPAASCGKLPVPLSRLNVCPHCGEPLPVDFEGIKPSRAPRMLKTPEFLWRGLECRGGVGECRNCPLSNGYETGSALLIWVGEKYYPTPGDFLKETRSMGVSRRIPAIPKEFILGETWVLLAHVKAVPVYEEPEPEDLFPGMNKITRHEPGIFSMFRPTMIEVVVTEETSPEDIDSYVKRGLTPVLVIQEGTSPTGRSDEDEIETGDDPG